MSYSLKLDELSVQSFSTSTRIDNGFVTAEPESDPGMCTCIDICPTDGTCIAYGCVNDPLTGTE